MAQGPEERRQGPGRERAERVAVGQDRGADLARVAAEYDLADRPAGVVADDGHIAERTQGSVTGSCGVLMRCGRSGPWVRADAGQTRACFPRTGFPPGVLPAPAAR